MITTIQRWGNSLALRIPKAFAAHAGLTENAPVDITVRGDTIVIRPARRSWTLDDLLDGITPKNLHGESEWGDGVGNELW